MNDIVERLRSSVMWYNANAETIMEAAAEIERLRAWNAEIALNAREFVAENEKLRAALESVMIGGNSLAQIIGADHPPHGTPYGEALAYYGGGVKYEAWCCWNTIMQARAALEGRT